MLTMEGVEALEALMRHMRTHGVTHVVAGDVQMTLGPATVYREVPVSPGDESSVGGVVTVVADAHEETGGIPPGDPVFDAVRPGGAP